MPSTLFYLTTRLSPQTTGVRIIPPGGLPEVTADDVRVATGAIKDAVGWQCISAKWLGDERSLKGLLGLTEARSWREWRKLGRKAKVDVFMHGKMAELSVLGWLTPDSSRTDEGAALYIGTAPRAFLANYKPHIEYMANWLQDRETSAWRDMSDYLWRDDEQSMAYA